MTISVNDSMPVSCHGYSDGSLTAFVTGGEPPFTFVWNNGNTTQTISGLCTGDYTVTVTDGENCIKINTFYVNEPEAINPTITLSQLINCHDDTTSLTVVISNGFPPYTILWNTQETTQTIDTVVSGFYQVTVTDSHNCSDSTEIIVPNPPLLVAVVKETSASCTNSCDGTIYLNIQGGIIPYQIIWNDGSTDTLRASLCSGQYAVTVSDNNGCLMYLQFYIDTLGYAPAVHATADDIVIYSGQSTTLHAIGTNNGFYEWEPVLYLDNPSLQNPVATPQYTTFYQVWLTDYTGCMNTDTVTIYVKDVFCAEPYIYVPNAFTPNNDGNNDILYVYTNMADEIYFAIYDRLGDLVFVSTVVTTGWDGTYKGKELGSAVFIYHLKVTCFNGEIFEKKGNVTLLR
ncbi:MAG: gliding motility-associated C-terminal domain-containing protein [Bacteroidia bacterium]|nr:gliding motility-associated C-terminal domain-containing protein [Bacteroidia bacterium]